MRVLLGAFSCLLLLGVVQALGSTPSACPLAGVSAPGVQYKYCSLSGDPHFTTFDNVHHDFQGVGVYTLASNPWVTVQGLLEKCGTTKSGNVTTVVTCLRGVAVLFVGSGVAGPSGGSTILRFGSWTSKGKVVFDPVSVINTATGHVDTYNVSSFALNPRLEIVNRLYVVSWDAQKQTLSVTPNTCVCSTTLPPTLGSFAGSGGGSLGNTGNVNFLSSGPTSFPCVAVTSQYTGIGMLTLTIGYRSVVVGVPEPWKNANTNGLCGLADWNPAKEFVDIIPCGCSQSSNNRGSGRTLVNSRAGARYNTAPQVAWANLFAVPSVSNGNYFVFRTASAALFAPYRHQPGFKLMDESEVTGTVYDLNGTLVVDNTPAPVGDQLQKANKFDFADHENFEAASAFCANQHNPVNDSVRYTNCMQDYVVTDADLELVRSNAAVVQMAADLDAFAQGTADDSKPLLDTGAVVGIAVGGACFVALAAAALFAMFRRMRRAESAYAQSVDQVNAVLELSRTLRLQERYASLDASLPPLADSAVTDGPLSPFSTGTPAPAAGEPQEITV